MFFAVRGPWRQRALATSRCPVGSASAALSPDGRWLAYITNTTGRAELWVRRYPTLDAAVRNSPNGAAEPAWAKNGRELFYLEDDKLMSVRVGPDTRARFAYRALVMLVEKSFMQAPQPPSFDVAADGRLLMLWPSAGRTVGAHRGDRQLAGSRRQAGLAIDARPCSVVACAGVGGCSSFTRFVRATAITTAMPLARKFCWSGRLRSTVKSASKCIAELEVARKTGYGDFAPRLSGERARPGPRQTGRCRRLARYGRHRRERRSVCTELRLGRNMNVPTQPACRSPHHLE